MSIAWGKLEDMAVHYLKELAKRGENPPILFMNAKEGAYGVGTLVEFRESIDKMGASPYRVVCMASADEFMWLVLVRFKDFMTEETDADKEKDISTGELFGSESAAVDAGGDRSETGGRGAGDGGQQEEDNH